VACRADDDLARTVEPATPRDRHERVIDRDGRRLAERLVHIADHADDRVVRTLGLPLRRDLLPDHALARPELLRERAAHDSGAAVRIGMIGVRQRTACEDGNAECLEVAVAHRALTGAERALRIVDALHYLRIRERLHRAPVAVA